MLFRSLRLWRVISRGLISPVRRRINWSLGCTVCRRAEQPSSQERNRHEFGHHRFVPHFCKCGMGGKVLVPSGLRQGSVAPDQNSKLLKPIGLEMHRTRIFIEYSIKLDKRGDHSPDRRFWLNFARRLRCVPDCRVRAGDGRTGTPEREPPNGESSLPGDRLEQTLSSGQEFRKKAGKP